MISDSAASAANSSAGECSDSVPMVAAMSGGSRMVSTLRASCTSRSAISATGSTKSTTPVAIAACGMPPCSLSSGDCASVTPPSSLMRCRPSAPSVPVPDSTTATAREPCTSASRRKTLSISALWPVRTSDCSCSKPSLTISILPGGST